MIKSPGFWLFQDVISLAECDSLLLDIEMSSAKRTRAGSRNLMSIPSVQDLARRPELIDLAESILESNVVPFKATLFEKTGKANWLVAFHQDTALPVQAVPDISGWGPSSFKEGVVFSHAPTWALEQIIALRIHIDDSTASNGPLRVISNSHEHRIMEDIEFEKIVNEGEKIDCLVNKGGVIAMSPLIFHASSKIIDDAPRRVLHIEYARSLELRDGVKIAIA